MASSASSFQRSSRYSTSTVRSFNTDSLHPRLHMTESLLWVTKVNKCFIGYQGDRESFGGYHGDQQYQTPQGGNQGDWILGDEVQGDSARGSGVSAVRARGNRYFLSADVSGFEPHEVVVVAYNQRVVIHAEKIGADGSVAGKFTHKSVLPADMNPLSVSSELTPEKMLIISIERIRDLSPLTSDLL
ncbi:hypothetical protein PO909_003693 [Leuciscus waleckii]